MKICKTAIWVCLTIIGNLLLSGCNSTITASIIPTISPTLTQITLPVNPTIISSPKPTQKPSSTLQLTLTPTLTPTKPIQGLHTWHPDLVLVRLQGWYPLLLQAPPELVIFSNGLVVIQDYSKETGYTPLGTQLNRQDLCRVLNTIDQYGFFDYDSTTYIEPIPEGPEKTIEINAWKTNRMDGGIDCWVLFNDPLLCCSGRDVDSCQAPVVMPALEKTYKFLSSYHPEGLKPLQINAVIVSVSTNENFEAYDEWPTFTKWPLPEFPLEELFKMSDEINGHDPFATEPLVFKGEELSIWLRYMPRGIYRDGDFIARVDSRPLWPYEKPSALTNFADDDNTVIPEDYNLTCTSEDGWIK